MGCETVNVRLMDVEGLRDFPNASPLFQELTRNANLFGTEFAGPTEAALRNFERGQKG